MATLKHYTVNVSGDKVVMAKEKGYHAYYANNVTAIEIMAFNKRRAKKIASQFGTVLYVFE